VFSRRVKALQVRCDFTRNLKPGCVFASLGAGFGLNAARQQGERAMLCNVMYQKHVVVFVALVLFGSQAALRSFDHVF
jgi:hypothetical protein